MFFFCLFVFMKKQRGKEKAVSPKLQGESAGQRTSPLGCIMVAQTTLFSFLPLRASIKALVRHNFPLLV